MPSFEFEAHDPDGRPIQGLTMAPSMSDALDSLRSKGYKVLSLKVSAQAAPRPQPVAPKPQPVKPVQQRPVAPAPVAPPTPAPKPQGPLRAVASSTGAAVTAGAAMPTAVSAAPAPAANSQSGQSSAATLDRLDPNVFTGRKLSERQTAVLFSQLSQLFAAGVAAVDAFSDLAVRHPKPEVRTALTDMANSARNGYPIAETMKKYPKLFSDSIISTIAVGEAAGRLPEACKQIQTHSEEALKYRRYFFFPILALINLVFVIPMAYFLYRAVTRAFSDTFQGRTEASPGAVIQIFFDTAIRQVGPWALLFLAIIGVMYMIWRSDKLRLLRHKVSATLPPYRHKARSENMERFSWALGTMMRTGAAPRTAWEMAAQTPPNVELRARFESVGDSMSDQTSLSEAMSRNPLFPEDFAMLMNTGEKTGATVDALDQFQRLSKTEMEAANRRAIFRGTSLGCLGLILASGVFVILFALAFYREIPNEVFRWMDDSMQ